MARHTLDAAALALAVEAVMASRGMSIADLAGELDLSTRVVRRVLDGGTPGADALLTVLVWLRLAPERVAVDTRATQSPAPAPHPQPQTPSRPVIPGDESSGG